MASKLHSEESSQTTRTVHIKKDKLTLEQLQQMVGGYIQILDINTVKGKDVKAQMILNEEGQMFNLPYNESATKIVAETYGPHSQDIVGDAVILYGRVRLK